MTTALRNRRKGVELLPRNDPTALAICHPDLCKLAESLANTAISFWWSADSGQQTKSDYAIIFETVAPQAIAEEERVQRHSKFLQAKFARIENKQDGGEKFLKPSCLFLLCSTVEMWYHDNRFVYRGENR